MNTTMKNCEKVDFVFYIKSENNKRKYCHDNDTKNEFKNVKIDLKNITKGITQ